MTDGGEPSGGLVGSHNMGATSATGNAWTDPFIFPMAASLRAQYSRASSMFIFKISDGLASMNALELMIAGPEGGPSSDMQRYEG